jgi:3-phenylpropionate/trans-cinnamate dioxygenase ferredoxin subunit
MGTLIPLCPVAEMEDGQMRHFEIMGYDILLVRLGDTWHALDGMCVNFASLADGTLDRENLRVTCAEHGCAYTLADGKPAGGPPTHPLETYKAWAEGDDVMIEFVY